MIHNNKVVVSSRQVAGSFNKMHKYVLASIKHLISLAEKSAQWFKQCSYKDSSGKSNIKYLMNRNGFMLLVMGFNGKTAIDLKIKYINAFDEMEAMLRERQKPKQISFIEQSEIKYVKPCDNTEYMKQYAVIQAYLTIANDMFKDLTIPRTFPEREVIKKNSC